MSGELPHAYTLMLIPTKHQIHPQGAGAKETGAMAKVLGGAPIPIVCWEIASLGDGISELTIALQSAWR